MFLGVGVWIPGENRVKILKGNERSKILPSKVHFTDVSSHEIGSVPDGINPSNSISNIKRLMGKKYADETVALDQKYASYSIASTQQNNAGVEIMSNRVYLPEELSSFILQDLKQRAESFLHKPIANLVVTVPAYFNDAQRKATIVAAEMAGFQGIRLLNEPTAAAMSYGLFIAGKKNVVVFDFGGGTFDVSVLSIDEGVFEVLGIGGDTHLGGQDLNHLILDHLSQHQTLTRDEKFKLEQQIEQAKVCLSTDTQVEISEDVKLTREEFNRICQPVFKKCFQTLRQVLREAKLKTGEIDEVILVGGSTRIPAVREELRRFFNGKELCTSVNADRAVAEGAAIQAAILSGIDTAVFRDVLMMDVIPLSIGIETADGKMEVLLPKNSKLPVSKTKYFETFDQDQQVITVEVYEGEDPIAKNNTQICYFNFILPKDQDNLHPVTLVMNENGVLQVQGGVHHDLTPLQPMSNRALYLLVLYLVLLMVLYLLCKVYLLN